MCAIFGFLDYGKKISYRLLTKLLKELSIAAECRGTDATGISYVKDGEMVTFKKAKPAHKVNLYFPKDTTAVIGHTRYTTQGSEKQNYNNHPFEGVTDEQSFALAHNGVLHNDTALKRAYNLPVTKIETDSYVAVQLLEQQNQVNMKSLKFVAEEVLGSFVFTVLRNDNMLFLVKDSNPVTLYHFPELGLYVYASTKDILNRALKVAKFKADAEEVFVKTGDILCIDNNGKLSSDSFEDEEDLDYFSSLRGYEEVVDEELECDIDFVCHYFGADRSDIEALLDYGYTMDEIEEMLLDDDYFNAALKLAKTLYEQW